MPIMIHHEIYIMMAIMSFHPAVRLEARIARGGPSRPRWLSGWPSPGWWPGATQVLQHVLEIWIRCLRYLGVGFYYG